MCYSVSQAVSIPAMLAAAVLLAVAAGSAAYTAYRFDCMHRTAKELQLMVEAQYAEARRRCRIQTWQKRVESSGRVHSMQVLRAESSAGSSGVFSIFSGMTEMEYVPEPLDLTLGRGVCRLFSLYEIRLQPKRGDGRGSVVRVEHGAQEVKLSTGKAPLATL